MFKFFLREKLFKRTNPRALSESPVDKRGTRNRRLFPRYGVGERHLTLIHDEDILVIQEISAKGFSSRVSLRAYGQLEKGSVHTARMRHRGEVYPLDVKVTWKSNGVVGFELVNATPATLKFLHKLLEPIALGESLKEVNAGFLSSQKDEGRLWFRGDNDTDLFVWKDGSGNIAAWQLRADKEYVAWRAGEGLSTGTLRIPEQTSLKSLTMPEAVLVQDSVLNKKRQQTAAEIFMALNSPLKNPLLATIER